MTLDGLLSVLSVVLGTGGEMYTPTEQEKDKEWFLLNMREAKSVDIRPSDVPCPCCTGVFMEQYTGKEFVDWTHRCPKCHVMYGCA